MENIIDFEPQSSSDEKDKKLVSLPKNVILVASYQGLNTLDKHVFKYSEDMSIFMVPNLIMIDEIDLIVGGDYGFMVSPGNDITIIAPIMTAKKSIIDEVIKETNSSKAHCDLVKISTSTVTDARSTEDFSSKQHETEFAKRSPEDSLYFIAEKEIVLSCGDASITLHRNGTISIRGRYILNRATGTNRILGGSVQIN